MGSKSEIRNPLSRRRIRKTLRSLGQALGQAAFWVAPTWVGKRIAWRNALRYQEQMLAGREATDRDRFRGAKWITSRLSPDSEAEEGLADAQDRSRDLTLNDPIAAGYVRGRVTNVVGTGLGAQARIRPTEDWEPANIDEDRAKRLNRQLESLWERWEAAASRCGRKSLWILQRLAERCCARDGECLIVLSDRPVPGKPVPLCVEVVSITRLETPTHDTGDARIRLGIETDAEGTPIAHWIRRSDPNDTIDVDWEYDRVTADRVCHVYEEEEGGQRRGWPVSVPAMGTLKDTKDFDEAFLIKKQTEACFAAFVENTGSAPLAAIAAATKTNSAGQRIEEVVPGMIRYLNPGEKVSFATPGAGAGADHGDFLATKYHRVAAGLNYPFELLVKDYGGTNYSSGRLSLLDGRAEFRAGQKFQIDLFLAIVWKRFVTEAVLSGQVDITPREYLAWPWLFQRHAWIPPGWAWVDPVKEVVADGEAYDRRFTTRSIVNAARGMDDDEVQEQWLREKMLDADNEKRLREYRQSIGLNPDPANAASGEAARSAAAQPEEKPSERMTRVRELLHRLACGPNGD